MLPCMTQIKDRSLRFCCITQGSRTWGYMWTPFMCWILQGSGWTSEQTVAVDLTLDWRQRPGPILSAASNTAGYLWAMKTFWDFPGPGAGDGTCDHNPLFVWYCRVSYKCCSLHTWFHWTSSARRWREERKTQIVWSHIRRQALTLAFIEPYVIYSL